MAGRFLSDAIAFFTVLSPFKRIPTFLRITQQASGPESRRLAARATLIAGGVLLFFVAGAQFVLEDMGVTIASFEIAGGIVMLLYGLAKVFREPDIETASETAGRKDFRSVAVLAVPGIATPYAMTTALVLTDNHRFDVLDQALTTLAMFLVLAVTYAGLIWSRPVQRLLGLAGITIVERVLGLLLAAFAVQKILSGITAYLGGLNS